MPRKLNPIRVRLIAYLTRLDARTSKEIGSTSVSPASEIKEVASVLLAMHLERETQAEAVRILHSYLYETSEARTIHRIVTGKLL